MPPALNLNPNDLSSFAAHLQSSTRVLALVGAGLSSSSGLPTFRGAGGLWRSYDATSLATPEAFSDDPGLVWQFYSYRRWMAKVAKPNRGHEALAKLAKVLNEGKAKDSETFLCLSQNVDGLSQRAGHTEQLGLRLLHGSLWDIKCADRKGCGYIRKNDFVDPVCEALRMPGDIKRGDDVDDSKTKSNDIAQPPRELLERASNTTAEDSSNRPSTSTSAPAQSEPTITDLIAQRDSGTDVSNPLVPLSSIPKASLPHCPQCHQSLLRPGVVWFNEALPSETLRSISQWIRDPPTPIPRRVDLMLVIGTSSTVYPAASYTELARDFGARVAVINLDDGRDARAGLVKGRDWMFQGDAAQILPEILKGVIGDL